MEENMWKESKFISWILIFEKVEVEEWNLHICISAYILFNDRAGDIYEEDYSTECKRLLLEKWGIVKEREIEGVQEFKYVKKTIGMTTRETCGFEEDWWKK